MLVEDMLLDEQENLIEKKHHRQTNLLQSVALSKSQMQKRRANILNRLPVDSQTGLVGETESARRKADCIQNKLYFRYKMKLERQRKKQHEEIEHFLANELERFFAPIKETERR